MLRVMFCAGLAAMVAACGSRSKLPDISAEAIKEQAARQVAFSFESFVTQTKRLQEVSFRIRAANAGYCGKNVAPLFGLSALSLANLRQELQPVAGQRLGLDASVRVVQAVRDSPARRAGLAPGDQIVAIGKRTIGQGAEGTRELALQLGKAKVNRTIRVTILRGTRQLTFPLRPVAGCSYPVVMSGQQDDEAVMDGGGIVIPRALMQLAASDDELALAVGHELAHRVAGHSKSSGDAVAMFLGGFPVNAYIATEIRGADDRKSFPVGYEKVADYLGTYFAARAGFNVEGVELFWRKLADADPNANDFARVHPAAPERFILIGKTKDEILLKQSSQAPLTPNWQPRN